MIHFDLPKQKSSIIKVLGVGGGGSNAVNFMFEQNIEGVDFIICNTDAKAIEQSNIPNKIQLGPHLTQGLGAGANPEVGKKATEESLEEIKRILEVNSSLLNTVSISSRGILSCMLGASWSLGSSATGAGAGSTASFTGVTAAGASVSSTITIFSG